MKFIVTNGQQNFRISVHSSLLLIVIAVFAAGMFFPAVAQLKIGYLDSNKIMEKSNDAIAARKKLQNLFRSWQQEAQNMEQEIQQKQETLEAQQTLLTREKIAERSAEIQNLYIRYQQFEQEKLGPGGEYAREETRLMQPIIEKVMKSITAIGEKHQYDYIFDTVDGRILYTSKSQRDFTDEVIQLHNAGN